MDCVEERVITTRLRTAISVVASVIAAVALSVTAWVTLGGRVAVNEADIGRHDKRIEVVEEGDRLRELQYTELRSDLRYIKETLNEIKESLK